MATYATALFRRFRKGPSRLTIKAGKGALAVTLTVVLTFVRRFNELSPHPSALSWAVLTAIIGSAGETLGGCIEIILFGTLGLGCGSFVFWILGQVGHSSSPAVVQGIVFAVFVYLASLPRFSGLRYRPFHLISILLSFQGLYTSVVHPLDRFEGWLLAYFQAFAWGLCIALAVNVLVWPTTSEGELRELLISSLYHVSTLAHLTCKMYMRDIRPDEREVRDLLTQTIRGDFSALTSHLAQTSYEVSYSPWTMSDLRKIIENVRGLQQALITCSSALDLMDKYDPQGVNIREHLMADATSASTFDGFRRAIDVVIAECIDRLANATVDSNQRPTRWDSEAQVPTRQVTFNFPPESGNQVQDVSARLREEVRRSELRQQHLRPKGSTKSIPRGSPDRMSMHPSDKERQSSVVDIFRQKWDRFAVDQTNAIITLIKGSSLHVADVLRITSGMPSLHTMYHHRLPKAWTSSLIHETSLRRLQPQDSASTTTTIEEVEDETIPCSEALTKAYSVLFGLGQFTDDLEDLHTFVSSQRDSRIRFHIFDRSLDWSWRKDPESMSLQAALAALHGDEYRAPPVPALARLAHLEKWFRGDRSVYALKVAIGAFIYCLLLLTSVPRPFFIKYRLGIEMTTALITVIVGISVVSTGQTLTTFLLQLTGTGLGSIFGLIVCEIFHNVGGYKYNPYGLCSLMACGALLASYPFYKFPKYYSGSLLAMNGAGIMLVGQWIYHQVPTEEQSFPDPPLRAAYSLAAMGISMTIASLFQIVLFRNPARVQLRAKIASVTFALSSYNTILQSNINAVAPADERPIPPPEALQKIQKELIKRESRIQSDIIALEPLFEFSKAEPQFLVKFEAETIRKVIRSHQVILDRLREARTAVGTTGFNQTVHKEFASTLYPYRLHSQRLARTLFYLGATSIVSKTPLPRDVPSSKATWASFENDALVLSRRLSKTPQGEEELRKPGFIRYWFYLVVGSAFSTAGSIQAEIQMQSLGSVSNELEQLEKHLGEWFGVPEITNPNIA